jgi:hypothetical protein
VADSPGALATGGGPIFIVGPMGSGTTLMRLIIDSHDNIAIAQETSIMRAYLAHKWIPFHRHGGDWYGRLGWSEDELDDRMRDFYSGMFERFAAEHGKSRWGDKTPWHTWHLRELARLFPDAVFVAMVRQPGAVAASVSERFRPTWDGAVGHWVSTTTEQVQRGSELGDRLLLVRYEDLVTDPGTTLREVFEWLDEPWSDRLLEHHVVHIERGTKKRVEGATRSDKPIQTDRIAAWAEGKTDGELGTLRERAGELAPFYGYDLSDPLALDPMALEGSPRKKTLTGTELAVRRSMFPHLADEFAREIVPWMGNRMLTPGAMGIEEHKSTRRAKKVAAAAARAEPAVPLSALARANRRVRRLARRLVSKAPGSGGAAIR